jgi:ATP-dependent 26S proteasome regulatory subunit
MANISLALPISRKFTYANFEQDDDIAYINSCRASSKIKFIMSENRIYRVVVNKDIRGDYTQPEYIIQKNHRTDNSGAYQAIFEFNDIPIVDEIEICSIHSPDLDLCTINELIEYVKSKVNLQKLVGRPIFYNKMTVHLIKNIEVGIKIIKHKIPPPTNTEISNIPIIEIDTEISTPVEIDTEISTPVEIDTEISTPVEIESSIHVDDEIYNSPIVQIGSSTIISISNNLKSSVCVNEIVHLSNDNVIDIIVSDFDKQSSSTTPSKNDIYVSLAELSNLFKKSKNDKSSTTQKQQLILKEHIINTIKTKFSSKLFKLKTNYLITVNKNIYDIVFDCTNVIKSDDVAYTIDSNVSVNIRDSTTSSTILDNIYTLTAEDEIIFRIISSDSNILLKSELTKSIVPHVVEKTILNGFLTTIYIGTKKVVLYIDDIYIKSTNDLNNSHKIAYVCNSGNIPKISFLDNTQNEISVVDCHDKYEIESLIFKPTKKETINNLDLALMFKLVDTVDVKLEKVKQYFKYKVRESCVFVGKAFEFDGVRFIVENITFCDKTINKNNHVIGFFSENSNITLNNKTGDKSINIINDELSTARNINVNLIKSMAKQMELDGMYGMEKYIDIIIKEVLITRTNLVSEHILDLIEPAKGIILHGPPGTGKTTFARNLGKLLACTGSKIKFLTSTEIKSKWHGESEGNVRKLFKDAIDAYELYGKDSPLYIVVIDEIEAILGTRSGCSSSDIKDAIVNQFLGEMDGLNQFDNCIFIGTTNRLDILDPACLRPGRFGCVITIDAPNEDQRKVIFESYHKKMEKGGVIFPLDQFDYTTIAKLTDGFTGAVIKNVFHLCVSDYINNKMNGNERICQPEDLYSILREKYKINV